MSGWPEGTGEEWKPQSEKEVTEPWTVHFPEEFGATGWKITLVRASEPEDPDV